MFPLAGTGQLLLASPKSNPKARAYSTPSGSGCNSLQLASTTRRLLLLKHVLSTLSRSCNY
jgi:hypothetical protein